MSEQEIQNALLWIEDPLSHANTCCLTVAAAYRQKCEEYDRLLEVAEILVRESKESCGGEWWKYPTEGIRRFEEVTK